MKNNNYIQIGFCNSPHGIKGEFVFNLFNKDSSVLKEGSVVYLKNEKKVDFFKFEILKINFGNKVIVKFKEIHTRNEVEALIPFQIFSLKSDWPKNQENEYYISDLIGLKVVDYITQLEIGTVSSFYENSIHAILEIKLINQKTIDVLFIDQFVKEVSLEKEIIIIIQPEYIE